MSHLQDRVLAVSSRLYRSLLKCYPAEFRRRFAAEMSQDFDDICVDACENHRWLGVISVWPMAISDLIASAASEHLNSWRNRMRLRQLISMALGSCLLGYSALFAAINILKYDLGLDAIWNPYQAIVESARPTFLLSLLNALIIVGPALALALFMSPLIKISFDRGREQMVTITIDRASRVTLLLLGACLLVGAVFLGYVAVENLPCLMGQQIAC